MASLNKVILIGNLGADPEVRFTGSGGQVANLRVATTERWQTGEKTEWHRVVVFGKQAENCKQYLSKGRQVYIEGRLQTRDWNDKEGNKRTTTEIVALRVLFLGSSPGARPASAAASDSASGFAPQPEPQATDPATQFETPGFEAGDEIPF